MARKTKAMIEQELLDTQKKLVEQNEVLIQTMNMMKMFFESQGKEVPEQMVSLIQKAEKDKVVAQEEIKEQVTVENNSENKTTTEAPKRVRKPRLTKAQKEAMTKTVETESESVHRPIEALSEALSVSKDNMVAASFVDTSQHNLIGELDSVVQEKIQVQKEKLSSFSKSLGFKVGKMVSFIQEKVSKSVETYKGLAEKEYTEAEKNNFEEIVVVEKTNQKEKLNLVKEAIKSAAKEQNVNVSFEEANNQNKVKVTSSSWFKNISFAGSIEKFLGVLDFDFTENSKRNEALNIITKKGYIGFMQSRKNETLHDVELRVLDKLKNNYDISYNGLISKKVLRLHNNDQQELVAKEISKNVLPELLKKIEGTMLLYTDVVREKATDLELSKIKKFFKESGFNESMDEIIGYLERNPALLEKNNDAPIFLKSKENVLKIIEKYHSFDEKMRNVYTATNLYLSSIDSHKRFVNTLEIDSELKNLINNKFDNSFVKVKGKSIPLNTLNAGISEYINKEKEKGYTGFNSDVKIAVEKTFIMPLSEYQKKIIGVLTNKNESDSNNQLTNFITSNIERVDYQRLGFKMISVVLGNSNKENENKLLFPNLEKMDNDFQKFKYVKDVVLNDLANKISEVVKLQTSLNYIEAKDKHVVKIIEFINENELKLTPKKVIEILQNDPNAFEETGAFYKTKNSLELKNPDFIKILTQKHEKYENKKNGLYETMGVLIKSYNNHINYVAELGLTEEHMEAFNKEALLKEIVTFEEEKKLYKITFEKLNDFVGNKLEVQTKEHLKKEGLESAEKLLKMLEEQEDVASKQDNNKNVVESENVAAAPKKRVRKTKTVDKTNDVIDSTASSQVSDKVVEKIIAEEVIVEKNTDNTPKNTNIGKTNQLFLKGLVDKGVKNPVRKGRTI